MSDLREVQTGVMVRWLEPANDFKFIVRLEDESEIVCGLGRNYFGRCKPQEAYGRFKKTGPKEGDPVTVLLVPEEHRGDGVDGIILRN